MNFKRIGRILVCLLLVCALLINISPIKAEAVVVELTAAQLLKWGVAAMVTLMTCGVFFRIQNEYELQDLGRTYYNHAYTAASAAERLDELEAMNEVIGEAVDNKIIPFGGSGALPGSFWKSLLSIATISMLDVFLKSLEGYFEAHYPSSGTLAVGESVTHNGVTYSVTSSSAPVFFFTQCAKSSAYSDTISCQTVFCSSKKFTWNRDVNFSYSLSQPGSSMTVDGVTLYCANEAISRDSYGTSCWACDSKWTVANLRARAAGIVGTGSPTYNITPSLIDGDLQEDYELVGDTHTLEIPDIDFSSMSTTQDIIDTANKIIDGEMTYEDLINKFSSGVAPSVVPLPEVNPSPDPDPDTGGDTGGNTGADVDTDYTTWFQKVVDWLEGIWEGITNLPSMILDGIEALLTKLFAPSEEFMQAKLQGLMDKYTFIQPMLETGNEFKSWFQGIGTTPPIIWIDLGAGTGWYPMGGKVKFIDLTWFEQYKSTSDGIIAAFLWLWFIWRILQTLPGIVQGFTGVIGGANHVPDAPFNPSPAPTNLLTGSEHRSPGDGSKRTWRRNGV